MLPHQGVMPVPSAFAAFASQLRPAAPPLQTPLAHFLQSPQIQSILQHRFASLQQQQQNAAVYAGQQAQANCQEPPANMVNGLKSPRTPNIYSIPRRRVGGSTMKTAKVWRFFDELPTQEQAAECRLCKKKIKATNSSTTGMIRHLRSCHVIEYQQVQEARQSSMLLKMEEKAKIQHLRDSASINSTGSSKKSVDSSDAQKSPSASSSASDTASSTASSSSMFIHMAPLPPLSVTPVQAPGTPLLPGTPSSLPAPKPVIKPFSMKNEINENDDSMCEQLEPTDLSRNSSAFAQIPQREHLMQQESMEIHMEDDESKKLNAQIALMIAVDQMPVTIVDKPGFRQLIRSLRPAHQLPFSGTFESELVPQILAQLRQFGAHFSAMLMINNPSLGNVMDSSMVSLGASSATEDNTSFDTIKTDSSRREEDSDSASSVDVESTSFVENMPEENTRITEDDLNNLSSVCHNIFAYFEARPHLRQDLTLTTASSDMATPPPESDNTAVVNLAGDPTTLQEMRFVLENANAVNSFIRNTPDMELLPVSEAQIRLLRSALNVKSESN